MYCTFYCLLLDNYFNHFSRLLLERFTVKEELCTMVTMLPLISVKGLLALVVHCICFPTAN